MGTDDQASSKAGKPVPGISCHSGAELIKVCETRRKVTLICVNDRGNWRQYAHEPRSRRSELGNRIIPATFARKAEANSRRTGRRAQGHWLALPPTVPPQGLADGPSIKDKRDLGVDPILADLTVFHGRLKIRDVD